MRKKTILNILVINQLKNQIIYDGNKQFNAKAKHFHGANGKTMNLFVLHGCKK